MSPSSSPGGGIFQKLTITARSHVSSERLESYGGPCCAAPVPLMPWSLLQTLPWASLSDSCPKQVLPLQALLPSCLSWPSQSVLLSQYKSHWDGGFHKRCCLAFSSPAMSVWPGSPVSPGLSRAKGAGGSFSEWGDGWVSLVLGDAFWAPAHLKAGGRSLALGQHQHLGCSATAAGQAMHALKMQTSGRWAGIRERVLSRCKSRSPLKPLASNFQKCYGARCHLIATCQWDHLETQKFSTRIPREARGCPVHLLTLLICFWELIWDFPASRFAYVTSITEHLLLPFWKIG